MSYRTHLPRSAGFTLVEILVGMAIALIGMVMMFQAMGSWEARKRTTASGSDAQVSGSIGMFTLERDLKLAGFGFGNAAAMGCTVSGYDSTRTAPGLFSFTMAPVLITNGDGAPGSTLPDSIAVLYGSATTMSSSQTFSSLSGAAIKLNTRTGIRNGDLLIAADAGNTVCGLFEATNNTNADGLSVDLGTVAYTNYLNNANVEGSVAAATLSASALALNQERFLNNSGNARFNNATLKGVGLTGAAFNLGTSPRLNVWRITNGRLLTYTNTLVNQITPTEVAEGIVDLQAEYGIDANNDGALAAGEWTSVTPLTAAEWIQVRAIRVGVLARSQQFEKTAVTPNAPTWAGGAFTMRDLNAVAPVNDDSPNDWRHYRYRVYETVIPLRNMLWGLD